MTSSLNRQTSVPEPSSAPRYLPFSIGPPDTTSEGRSQLAAPMTSDGVVLSQPHSSTTPSIGFPRIDSSTSMLARLRKSIAVGRRLVSPSDITGNSNGTPPASQTPRLTCSASCRKWPLHGVSSDHVLQIPMSGRPSSKIPSGNPRPTQLRWMKPSLSALPNQAAERYLRFGSLTPSVSPSAASGPRRPLGQQRVGGRLPAQAIARRSIGCTCGCAKFV